MDATTIIISIAGSSFFSAIALILNPIVQYRLQRQDRKRADEQHRMDMQERGMKLDRERFDALHQAKIDFPPLDKWISEMPMGLGRTETDTSNTKYPVVFVEKKEFGIEISWGPEKWKTAR